MSKVVELISGYIVGDPDEYHFQVHVERADKSGIRWAVRYHGDCLSTSGEWDDEPMPSSRTEEWLATHRFPLAEALRMAHAQAEQIIAEWQARKAAR